MSIGGPVLMDIFTQFDDLQDGSLMVFWCSLHHEEDDEGISVKKKTVEKNQNNRIKEKRKKMDSKQIFKDGPQGLARLKRYLKWIFKGALGSGD